MMHYTYSLHLQTLVLHGPKHSQKVSVPLFSVAGGPVAASRRANYYDIVSIPPVPPSRLDGCSLIDLYYILVVRTFTYFELTCRLLNIHQNECSEWLLKLFAGFYLHFFETRVEFVLQKAAQQRVAWPKVRYPHSDSNRNNSKDPREGKYATVLEISRVNKLNHIKWLQMQLFSS